MSLQVYRCSSCGEFDRLVRCSDLPSESPCPKCGNGSPHVFKPPSIIAVKRDWNEQANDYQRDPYTQAKAQLRNSDRENQWYHGERPIKVTEEAIQLGAREIDRANRSPPASPVQRRIEKQTRA